MDPSAGSRNVALPKCRSWFDSFCGRCRDIQGLPRLRRRHVQPSSLPHSGQLAPKVCPWPRAGEETALQLDMLRSWLAVRRWALGEPKATALETDSSRHRTGTIFSARGTIGNESDGSHNTRRDPERAVEEAVWKRVLCVLPEGQRKLVRRWWELLSFSMGLSLRYEQRAAWVVDGAVNCLATSEPCPATEDQLRPSRRRRSLIGRHS